MPDMYKKYKQQIVSELKQKRDYKNIMEVPKLKKIVISNGIDANAEKDMFAEVTKQIAKSTGQAPVITKAKKSVANFKLREGMPVGVMVTLRGSMMYDFLDRLVHNTYPRVRDFRGISKKGFDGSGNYSTGIQDVTVFTEIDPDKIKYVFGFNITFVTSAKTDDEALELLQLLELPFA